MAERNNVTPLPQARSGRSRLDEGWMTSLASPLIGGGTDDASSQGTWYDRYFGTNRGDVFDAARGYGYTGNAPVQFASTDGGGPDQQGDPMRELADWMRSSGYTYGIQPTVSGGQFNAWFDPSGEEIDGTRREIAPADDGTFWTGALLAAGLAGGAAAGAWGGTGAAASTGATPVWNAALAESAVGTAGYGASSLGAGGGAGLLGGGAAAGGSSNLTPAAMESLIGTPGYGANASADLLVGAGNSGGNALMGFDSIANPGLWDGTAMGEPAAQSVEVVGRRLPPIPEPSAAGGVAAVAPQMGGMEYSNEGRNYPDPQSTQGPGGSPVNAGQTPGGFNWQGLLDKAMQNPRLIGAVAGGLLGGAEGGSGGGDGGAGAYTGPMPTITRGDWSPTAKATMMDVPKFGGLLPQTGQANSGLWRFKG